MVCLFTASLSGVSASLPQKPSEKPPSTEESEPLLRIHSDLVALDVTVTNEHGEYVRGLRADDFKLFEDGKPCSIDFFQANASQGTRQVAMVFAVDFSGSVTPHESELQRQALSSFLKDQHPQSLFALIGFNQDVKVLEGFTRDSQKLNKAFEKFKDYGGSTRIYDAIDRSITLLKKVPKSQGPHRIRRYIVILTDGFDSSSMLSASEVVRRAIEEEVSIFTVTVPSYILTVSGRQRVPTFLDALHITTATGGRDFPVEDGTDYAEAFKALSTDVKESYTLAYQPASIQQDKQAHKLTVTTQRPGLRLRLSRESYIK